MLKIKQIIIFYALYLCDLSMVQVISDLPSKLVVEHKSREHPIIIIR